MLHVILQIGICHNVRPIKLDGQRMLRASSPDEISLVSMVEHIGLYLQERTAKEMRFNLNGIEIRVEILDVFPFKSKRKRMGIIVKLPNRKIYLYMKGADSVMAERVDELNRGFLLDESEDLAN